MNKRVYLIGDITHAGVARLITDLRVAGVEAIPATEDDQFDVAIFCYTRRDPAPEEWRIVDKNRNARFLPVQFEDGRIPGIFASDKPADFRKDPKAALAALLKAIEKFC